MKWIDLDWKSYRNFATFVFIKTILHFLKLRPCFIYVNIAHISIMKRNNYLYNDYQILDTFYVDYYKGLALSQFQSHKLVSIPFRVNWLILRSIIVQQRCRDSRNHRERNGEKSIYSHYHHSFLFPHRRQKVKLDKPMW